MAKWTAYLYDKSGLLRAALGGGMYAEGETRAEALADAERQIFALIDVESCKPEHRAFAEKANATTLQVKAEGYTIDVRKQRGR